MFATIGRTWNLAKLSWAVLMKDKELLLFPVMSFVSIALIVGLFLSIALATGSFDRLDAAMSRNEPAAAGSQGVTPGDVLLYVLGFFAVTFAGIFFNSALVAAAIERLRGGNATVVGGLARAFTHIHAIFVWAIIAATVGLILQAARSNTENFLGRLALALVGGIWAYMTFFVVPMLVVRGLGPIAAIKESAGLFRRTWGEQVTANFGFGIFYIAAIVVVAIPALLIGAVNPIAGIVVAVPLAAIALGAVAATEGVFKAALFEYAAEGVVPQGYTQRDLDSAYQPQPR
jgi:hypothetical protein